MYGISAAPRVTAYTDRWRPSRYRVELNIETSFDDDDIDEALEQLGYHVVDADQAGRSYVSQRGRNHFAELDDTGDWRASAHLVLGTDDLEKPQIDQASDYLCSIYEKIYRICRKESFLSNHYQWDDLLSAESESDRLHYPQLQDLR